MTGRLLGIFGTSGFAREVAPVARLCFPDRRLVFVDREPGPEVNGIPVMEEEAFLSRGGDADYTIAIADGGLRERIAERCDGAGATALSLVDPGARILDGNEIAAGAVLCAFSMVTSNARIGRHVHLNLRSYVAHDCVIGDFVTFAPGVCCNGNVTVGDHAYLGTGAILKQGTPGKPLTIGAGAVVGMGAVVTRDVAPGAVVVGNPARPLQPKGDKG